MLKGEQGLLFIDEALAAITGLQNVQLDPQARQDLYNAMQILYPESEGYNLDDFMRTLTNLAAWHKGGKPSHKENSSN